MWKELVCIRGHTFISGILGNSSRVVDLGVNCGDFAYEMRRRYGCYVYGAEANPKLAKNIQQGPMLVCDNIAISDRTGQVYFYIDHVDQEASSLNSNHVRQGSERFMLNSLILKDFFAKHNLGVVDLVKMDIEGAEMTVLANLDFSVSVKQMSVEFHAFHDRSITPSIKVIIEDARAKGFYVVDFSRTFMDVLFVNSTPAPTFAAR